LLVLLALLALLGLLAWAPGCLGQGQAPPGEVVGSFEAEGLIVEQSCGAAIPSPDPLELSFELRSESNGRAYWRRQGGSMFAGTEKDGQYTFQVSQSWMVIDPDRFHGYAGCSVTQRDVFTFVVDAPEAASEGDAGVEDAGMSVEDAGVEEEPGSDAGIDPALVTLTGSQTTEITPLTGSDCTPAVAALGGPFLALPCRIEYVLTGNGIAAD